MKSHPNFAGIDFCDVQSGGILIRGHHAYLTNKYGYTYPNHTPKIKYDFSNLYQAIDEFVQLWIIYDQPVHIEKTERMYEELIRYDNE